MSYLTTAFEKSVDIRKNLKQRPEPIIDANYDTNYLLSNIQLPSNPMDIPNIIGWSGPARTGTSALLFLLAGHPQIDRVYFQPQKTLLRFGEPEFKLYEEDSMVCMKEVFYSQSIVNPHDPIDILLRAGVPEEKITWIIMLRDPLQTFASWGRNGTVWSPETFAFWQKHTISLWEKYKNSKVNVVPFVYELLDGREERVLKKLLSKVGVDALGLGFDPTKIDTKLVPGEATSGIFFVETIEKTINQGRYAYTPNSYPVVDEDARAVVELCQEGYDSFLETARTSLGVE
jgi:hypothetical protein